MTTPLILILLNQQRQLDLLYSQISILSLSSSQSSTIRELTPLQRHFRDIELVNNVLIKEYKNDSLKLHHNNIVNLTDTQPIPLIPYSLRLYITLKEYRIKLLILLLLGAVLTWIGMHFLKL
jgi:hypothetical protein